jgi:fatty-acyl-CoA synthase
VTVDEESSMGPSQTDCVTITERLDAFAASTPAAPAAAFLDGTLSYRELADASLEAARRQRAAGIGAGDRVAVLRPEVDGEYLATVLGTARLGAITVPLNARYKAVELEYALADAAAKLLLAAPWFEALLGESRLPSDCRVVVDGDDDDYLAAGSTVADDDVGAAEAAVGPEDPVRIIYTSGTTAHPKGCLHDHAALLAQGAAVAERIGLTAGDRFWTPLPMFHTAGWSTLLAAQAAGACFSHCGIFDAERALDQITEQHCTVLFPGFETVWMAVLDHPRFAPERLDAARLVINVGVPERMRLMQERLPGAVQVSNTGSTEACGWLAIGEASESPAARSESAGPPLAGMEVRIADPDSGLEAAGGEPGELLFRGPCRLREYWRDPEGTAAAIDAAGWFHSGDLVRRHADGTLAFLSRLKDMLKVGGENVAAAEIEGYLLTHPAVHAAHVVAAPDARYGEVPAAFVEPAPGATVSEAELIDFCVGRIATFKVPRYVRTVSEWPMSGTKVRKVELRERIAAELERAGVREAPRIATGAGR